MGTIYSEYCHRYKICSLRKSSGRGKTRKSWVDPGVHIPLHALNLAQFLPGKHCYISVPEPGIIVLTMSPVDHDDEE